MSTDESPKVYTIPPPAWTPTNAEYHATKGRWTSSRLALFHKNPRLAYERYIAGTHQGEAPTTAMELGSALSMLLTDKPDKGAGIYVADASARNAKAFSQARLAYPERLVLTAPEFEKAVGMSKAILQPQTPMAETARALLFVAPGYSE